MGNGYTMSGDSIKYTYTIGGSYFTQLFVTTDAGCIDSIGKFYTIYDIPKAAFTYNPFVISTLQPEMNFITTTPNITNAFWDFDDSTTSYMLNPVHEFNKAGFYDVMLMVEDTNQCIDSITQRITMYYDFVLHVPNAFTPDDDGLNDTFGPTGPHMENYLSYEFIVYNRWGEKVFATNNINEKWSGLNAQHGTYSWVVIITDEIGGVHKKEGSVTLIK
jgi:gliding motility-associated-like protein